MIQSTRQGPTTQQKTLRRNTGKRTPFFNTKHSFFRPRYLGVKPKLTVNAPNDIYEKEADRVADKVMRMPNPQIQRQPEGEEEMMMKPPPPTVQRKCAECEEEDKLQRKTLAGNITPLIQRKGTSGGEVNGRIASALQTNRGGGRPLPDGTRSWMESRFGADDFSQVNIHTDSRAVQLSRELNAQAFTHGRDIYFNRGKFAPGTSEGKRLLAPRLFGVVQQGNSKVGRKKAVPKMIVSANAPHHLQRSVSDKTVTGLIVQRQPRRRRTEDDIRLRYFVVRDRELNAGDGTYAANLAVVRRYLMRSRTTREWTLVLSIHGGQNLLAAQAPPNWQQNAIFYDESAINRLFGDNEEFVRWRDRYGPTQLVLNSCQVSIEFERVLINNLTRGGEGVVRQTAQGLGEGCRPHTTTHTFTDVPNPRAFRNLPESRKNEVTTELRELNSEWGYLGRPPVPEGQILHYFLRVPPVASWVKVEVVVGDNHRSTNIPFWNRARNPRFHRLCDQGVGRLRDHQPRVPPLE